MHRGISWIATVIMWLVTMPLGDGACPFECDCSRNSISCTGKGLKTVPKGIPLNVSKIDLSNNPSIHIPREYFLKFERLYILSLDRCGQRGPLLLPNTLRIVSFKYNLFTMEALREMLNQTNLLTRLSLKGNNLHFADIQQLLRLLPATLEAINLGGSTVTEITSKDIARFKNLKTIRLRGSSLRSIEAHALDNLTQLHTLFIFDNELSYIPEDIFRLTTKLRNLCLARNKLSVFNATNLGIQNIYKLDLRQNKIRTLDLKTIQPREILLNDNSIERLDRQMFNNNRFPCKIFLNNNNIRYISKNVFKSMEKIHTLSLQNNSLQSLPPKIFQGLSISKLLLQQNRLSTIAGVFDGIKSSPVTLHLEENKELQNIKGADVMTFRAKSQIYITCSNLRNITDLSQIKARFVCSPKADLVINTTETEGLDCKGYQCTFEERVQHFICRACNEGYYSLCVKDTKCTKCPPGSYYQDQPARVKCKECRPGQFIPPERSPGTSPLDCQTCPQGTNTSIIAGTRACKCLHGYSRRYRFGPCHKCNHNGFDCTNHEYQILQNGFWMTWKGTNPGYTESNSTPYNQHQNTTICQYMYNQFITNLDITDDTYNRTTMQFNCHMPLPIKCPMFDSCLGGIHPTCSRGYNGVLCAVCDRGYIPQFNQCIQCPKPLWASLQFIGYIALFVIFCFIISLTDQIIIDESRNCLQRKEQYDSRTFADIILSSLKILIGFYQIFISIMHAFSHIHWPHNVKTVTNILQYVQFQIIKLPSLRCIKPQWNINAVDEFWIMLIIIITIPFLSVLYYFIKSIYTHFQYLAPSVAKHKRYICARNCIKIVALFLFVTYPLISTKTIEILPISCHSFCTANHNDNCIHSMSFLRSDYSIPCPTMANHKATLITGYICLIISFGLPIILLLLLRSYAPKQRRRNFHRGNEGEPTCQEITNMGECIDDDDNRENLYPCPILSRDDADNDNLSGYSTVPVITSALKFSYENYHARYWYWEVIEMIRKLLMTIGIVLFLRHTKIGLTCTLIVAMIFTVLHSIIKPLRNNCESGAQFISLVLVPLNLAYGAVLQSQDTQNPSIISKEKDMYYGGMCLVVSNSSLIIIVIVRIIVVIGKAIRSKWKKSK